MLTNDLLRKIDALAALDDGQLTRLAAIAEEREYGGREVIIHEGSTEPTLYGLLRGQVTVQFNTGPRSVAVVDEVLPGEVFGWSTILPPYASQGDAQAVDTVRVVKFEGKKLRALMAAEPELGRRLLEQVGALLSQKLRRERVADVAIATMPA